MTDSHRSPVDPLSDSLTLACAKSGAQSHLLSHLLSHCLAMQAREALMPSVPNCRATVWVSRMDSMAAVNASFGSGTCAERSACDLRLGEFVRFFHGDWRLKRIFQTRTEFLEISGSAVHAEPPCASCRRKPNRHSAGRNRLERRCIGPRTCRQGTALKAGDRAQSSFPPNSHTQDTSLPWCTARR